MYQIKQGFDNGVITWCTDRNKNKPEIRNRLVESLFYTL